MDCLRLWQMREASLVRQERHHESWTMICSVVFRVLDSRSGRTVYSVYPVQLATSVFMMIMYGLDSDMAEWYIIRDETLFDSGRGCVELFKQYGWMKLVWWRSTLERIERT